MRIYGSTAAAVALHAILVGALVAGSQSPWAGVGGGRTTDSGFGWYYSVEKRAFYRISTPRVTSSEPEFEYRYVAACDTGSAADPETLMCGAAFCQTPDGKLGTLFYLYRRPTGSTDSGAWSAVRTSNGQLVAHCARGVERVPLEDVEAEVRRIIEDKFKDVARPSIELRPRDTAIVNLPVIAWTADQPDVALEIENPLPGRISATPAYTWSWSNGTFSKGPGTPYTPQVSPSANPGYYVSAIYSARGPAQVTLTVTWSAVIEVPGIAPVPLDPLTYISVADFTVASAGAVLVDG